MAKAQAQTVAGTTKRTSKAAASGDAPAPEKKAAPKKDGEKGAPRPRKYDYGIQPENKVSAVKRTAEQGEPKLKAGEAEGYEAAKRNPTVEAFLANHDRGILRRLSRKGLITITAKDGTTYPREYVAPEKPEPKAKAQAGEKAA